MPVFAKNFWNVLIFPIGAVPTQELLYFVDVVFEQHVQIFALFRRNFSVISAGKGFLFNY